MTTPDQLQSSYERLLYPLLSYRQAHPNRFATVATLLGMSPAPIDQCRVLDLGCASGGHIIPMAANWPNSHFVGVDFGQRQIEEGQRFIADLGLNNIELIAADVRAIDESYGQFDYIIVHGLFSWVPEEVREHILRVCKTNLAPQGVVYISYNAYPGWHMLNAARRMMLYHTEGIEDPNEKVDAALSFIDFITRCQVSDSPAYQNFLRAYQELITHHKQIGGPRELSSVYHDELEMYNRPYYFHEFMALAKAHGLDYLAEADFAQVFPTSFAPEVQQRLAEWGGGSVIDIETYMDFLRNRTFRQTLLVHEDAPVRRRLSLRPIVSSLYITGLAQPQQPPTDGDLPDTFIGGEGITFRTDHPITQAAFLHLAEHAPQAFSFSDLIEAACTRLGIEEASADDAEGLALNLLRAYTYSLKLVEFEVAPSPFVNNVSEKPKVSEYVRYFARLTTRVTSARHERVELDPITRTLVLYTDGTRTKDDLIAILQQMVNEGQMAVKDNDGNPITDAAQITALLTHQVELSLSFMRRAALLVG